MKHRQLEKSHGGETQSYNQTGLGIIFACRLRTEQKSERQKGCI